jgi:hypothetical protein
MLRGARRRNRSWAVLKGESAGPRRISALALDWIRQYPLHAKEQVSMRRVPAILIVVFLACPLLFAALVSLSLATWTVDRHFYLSVLDDSRLYQVPDAISTASWSGAVIEGTGGLQWKSVGRALRVVLTPEYLRAQSLRVVNQAFDFFDGRNPRFEIAVDSRPVKDALKGDAGKTFARYMAEDLPVGGSAEGFKVGPGRLPASRPSTVSVDRAAAAIQSGLPTFLASVPDTVRLDDGSWGEGHGFRFSGAFFAGCIILLLIAGGFLTAAAFTGGQTAFERLQWYGWSLLAPAAGVLLLGLLVMLSFISPWVQLGIASARLEAHGFSSSFVAALIDAARHVVSRVGIGFLATGGIASGIALGLLAWSWAIPRNERKGVTS